MNVQKAYRKSLLRRCPRISADEEFPPTISNLIKCSAHQLLISLVLLSSLKTLLASRTNAMLIKKDRPAMHKNPLKRGLLQESGLGPDRVVVGAVIMNR